MFIRVAMQRFVNSRATSARAVVLFILKIDSYREGASGLIACHANFCCIFS